jgi:tripartite-type tricarboxylate transporter receptor subunit TctC
MPFCKLLPRLVGAAIAVSAMPSDAIAQTLRLISSESVETHKTETPVAGAQANRATPFRVLVPCPVGSPADILARYLAQMLSEKADGQFYVENFTSGAGSPTLTEQAQADGRTLLLLPGDPTMPSACGD